MRITRLLATLAFCCALTLGAALPATARSSHGSAGPAAGSVTIKLFKSTVTPSHRVRTGKTLTMKAKHAKRNTTYNCYLLVRHGTTYGLDLNSFKTVTSNKKGRITCHQVFHRYIVTDTKGHTRHCPLTRADHKAGFQCTIGLGTSDGTSGSVATFYARASK